MSIFYHAIKAIVKDTVNQDVLLYILYVIICLQKKETCYKGASAMRKKVSKSLEERKNGYLYGAKKVISSKSVHEWL